MVAVFDAPPLATTIAMICSVAERDRAAARCAEAANRPHAGLGDVHALRGRRADEGERRRQLIADADVGRFTRTVVGHRDGERHRIVERRRRAIDRLHHLQVGRQAVDADARRIVGRRRIELIAAGHARGVRARAGGLDARRHGERLGHVQRNAADRPDAGRGVVAARRCGRADEGQAGRQHVGQFDAGRRIRSRVAHGDREHDVGVDARRRAIDRLQHLQIRRAGRVHRRARGVVAGVRIVEVARRHRRGVGDRARRMDARLHGQRHRLVHREAADRPRAAAGVIRTYRRRRGEQRQARRNRIDQRHARRRARARVPQRHREQSLRR